jgi:phospholipase D1/2
MLLSDVVQAARHHATLVSLQDEDVKPANQSSRSAAGYRPALKLELSDRTQTSATYMRTGPPRSLSGFVLPGSPSKFESAVNSEERDPHDSEFRSALEVETSEQGDKGKKRENSLWDESWTMNPMKWFQESPRDESPRTDPSDEKDENKPHPQPQEPTKDDKTKLHPIARNDQSTPRDSQSKSSPTVRWNRLRSMLPSVISQGNQKSRTPSTAMSPAVNIADELMTGGLSILMLRLWFERDEKNHRRVPVLLHRLRIRVSDSLHPLHGNKSVFRVECEYGNGVARWVVYRQLRDFLSLHTHYTFSNVYYRNVVALPEFPRTSEFIKPHQFNSNLLLN